MTNNQLIKAGRLFFVNGIGKDRRRTRATENLTQDQAKKWTPDILAGFFEKFEVVKDRDLQP